MVPCVELKVKLMGLSEVVYDLYPEGETDISTRMGYLHRGYCYYYVAPEKNPWSHIAPEGPQTLSLGQLLHNFSMLDHRISSGASMLLRTTCCTGKDQGKQVLCPCIVVLILVKRCQVPGASSDFPSSAKPGVFYHGVQVDQAKKLRNIGYRSLPEWALKAVVLHSQLLVSL